MAQLAVRTVVDGCEITPAHIAAWEASRLPKAAKKLGVAPPTGTLDVQRMAFARAKLALGPEEIRKRLCRDLALSKAVARAGSLVSRRRARMSVCDLYVGGGSAEDFVTWFADTQRTDYALTMVAANPDHFLIDVAPDGTQEVIETTGGSPVATHFRVDYTDTSTLVSTRDSSFPIELAGVARDDDGRAIGGVRHQFRDEPGGFHARLLVEFPSPTPSHLIRRHQWHLGCEFGNWVRFAMEA